MTTEGGTITAPPFVFHIPFNVGLFRHAVSNYPNSSQKFPESPRQSQKIFTLPKALSATGSPASGPP